MLLVLTLGYACRYRDVEQATNEADEGGTNGSSPTAEPSNGEAR